MLSVGSASATAIAARRPGAAGSDDRDIGLEDFHAMAPVSGGQHIG